MQQPILAGIGGALRKVRTSRGLSLDEAARDTRVRQEFLEAIEQDDFDRLLGDVHVRGCLRTYASYLRLSPDKVVAAYLTSLPDGGDRPPAATPQPEPVLGAPRRRDNHRLFVMVAAMVLVLAAAFGVLSARQPAPPPADLSSEAPPLAIASARGLTVGVLARLPVRVTITADGGEPRSFALQVGEGRSFHAQISITVQLSEGGTAKVTVNGDDKGFPGAPDRPWQDTFEFATPSPPG